MTDKLKLWKSVEKTDPSHTRKVEYGRKFTAIDAMYQIKEATKHFGPYGGEWGIKNLSWSYIPAEKPQEIILDAVFYYPSGEFEISTDATYKPGNDSRKKLLTDITTKALSKLGFNADVFMGLFDDNKYVAERSKEELTNKRRDEAMAELQHFIDESGSKEEVIEAWESKEALRNHLNRSGVVCQDMLKQLNEQKETKIQQLAMMPADRTN